MCRTITRLCIRTAYTNRDFSRNAEEAAAERPRAALEQQSAFQYTPHRKSGGEEMRVDNTRRERQEKKRKSQSKSQLEAMIFSVIQSCIKSTVDEAMKEIFKDFK